MAEETTESKTTVVGEALGEIFCVKCGGKLKGMVNGTKDTCPYDDCGVTFSVRIY